MKIGYVITNALKVFFLLMLVLVIALGGIYWFDYLGLIDYKSVVGPLSRFLPAFMQRGQERIEDSLLLEREFLAKREEILLAKTKELERRTEELEKRELTLKESEAKLREEAKSLEEEKKLLSEKVREYDNYTENIKTQAQYFTGMPPAAAVERLARLDDLLVVDILRQIDRNAEEEGRLSMVPYFLSLMDPDRAAALQRKMTKVGEQNE